MSEKLFGGVFDSEEMSELWNNIVENSDKLKACDYHDFVLIEKSESGLVSKNKYQCVNCGGRIDGLQHQWHELGRRAKPGTDL